MRAFAPPFRANSAAVAPGNALARRHMKDPMAPGCAEPPLGTEARGVARRYRRRAAFLSDRRGTVAIMVGLAVPVLVGFMGFAIDLAMWEGSKVGAQAAADQAALAAGLAIGRGGSAQAEARAVAASFGYLHGTGGVVVAVNQPPTTGTYSSNAKAVEVIVSKPEGPYFSLAYRPTAPTVSARSVSAPIGTASGGGMCVMALEPTATGISASGTPLLDANTCNIYVNSTNNRAVNITGTVKIKGYDIFIGGGIRSTGSAAVTPSHELQTYYSPATPDPYAARVIPSFSGCNATNPSYSGSETYTVPNAGTVTVICGNLDVSGSGTVNFPAGIYIFDRGSFQMSGTMTVNATGGVTLIFTSANGSGIGSVSTSGSQTFNIKAPPTGASAGIAIWIDKRAASSSMSVSGSSVWNVTGAIYVPNSALTWSGSGTSPCTQLVAKTINISGSGQLKHDCAGVGVSDPPGSGGSTLSRLVE